MYLVDVTLSLLKPGIYLFIFLWNNERVGKSCVV